MKQEEVDVIVVGGGGSGLSAAISAADAGARTLLLEKNPKLGGTTVLSVGSITAAGTRWQKAQGIEDTPDEHFADMDLFLGPLRPRENLALRRVLVDHVPATLEWLHSIGLQFFGPMPEPPHQKLRMHNVLPNSRAYGYHLAREARRQGVELRINAVVVDLLTDGGRVRGVRARIDGVVHEITAVRGVVLASGDFSASEEFKRLYKPDATHINAVNPTSTGDGQRMALQLGGQVLNGDLIWGPSLRFRAPARETLLRRLPPWSFLTRCMKLSLQHLPISVFRPFIMSFMTSSLSPEPTLFKAGAVLINRQGERFTDECATPAFDIARQEGKCAYLVFDSRVARLFEQWPNFISTAPGLAYAYLADYRRTRKDLFHEADSLAALAVRMGVPPEALERSIQQHNAQLPERNDPELQPVLQAPFYALGPVLSWVVIAEGGLAVDTQHRVLDGNGQPIPGLWAAGSTGQGGLVLAGHGHHIGWATTSGRRAGRFAAGGSEAPRAGTASA